MQILPYSPEKADEWNRFVDGSRNGTFIHRRDFMDYHADRYPDASLMMYDNRRRLIAVLPATAHDGSVVSSHNGLTYGGWLSGPLKPTQSQMLEGWRLMAEHYRARQFKTLIYKPVPHIYHNYPAEEDLYALYRWNAQVDMVLASTVIDLTHRLPPNTGTRRHIKRAAQADLTVAITDDYGTFWHVLSQRLRERYNTLPVHTLAEIRMLSGRFPDNIKLWTVTDPGGNILAGTVLFLSNGVVKSQYIGTSAPGREVNATDYMFSIIADHYTRAGFRYLDMGHSNEDHGRALNEGLVNQKTGYGGRTIVYTTYRLSL